jgi:hypothetical protein
MQVPDATVAAMCETIAELCFAYRLQFTELLEIGRFTQATQASRDMAPWPRGVNQSCQTRWRFQAMVHF